MHAWRSLACGLFALAAPALVVPDRARASDLTDLLQQMVQPLPAGSWRSSCSQAVLVGPVLTARCLRDDGSKARAVLNITQCQGGPLANLDGQLVCESDAYGTGATDPYQEDPYQEDPYQEDPYQDTGATGGLPGGDWTMYCQNPAMYGSVLQAQCQNDAGQLVVAQVDTAQCPGMPLTVQDGMLYCTAGAPSGQQYPEDDSTDEEYEDPYQQSSYPEQQQYPEQPSQSALLPAGDWEYTCQNPRLNGAILQADCAKLDGTLRRAAIDVDACQAQGGSISNSNGTLVCATGPGGTYADTSAQAPAPSAGGLPLGSYRASCQKIKASAVKLQAECATGDGSRRLSTIDPRTCPSTISNVDGYLVCD